MMKLNTLIFVEKLISIICMIGKLSNEIHKPDEVECNFCWAKNNVSTGVYDIP